MADRVRLWREHRGELLWLLALGAAGAFLVVDGALRGEARHRLVGVVLGSPLLVPLAIALARGTAGLRISRRLTVAAGTVLLALGGMELVIRAFDIRAFSVSERVADPVLGHVYVPGRGALDDWGWRNPGVPERADVVCMGDSMTFGTNVRERDTWPRALGRHAGLGVYNMGMSGFGPIQYAALAEQALALNPAAIVVGFFFGNDLADAHRFAGLDHWAALRDPAFEYTVPEDLEWKDERSLNVSMAVVDGLLEHSRLVGSIGEDLKLAMKVDARFTEVYWKEGPGDSWGDGKIRTRFITEYREGLVDVTRPRIGDGLRITRICFDNLARDCRAHEVTPVLLLFHTKEFYYHRFLAARGAPEAAALATLARAEEVFATRMLALAERFGMRVIDPLPEIVAALEADVALWPQGADGHFNPAGGQLVAEVVWRELDAWGVLVGEGR